MNNIIKFLLFIGTTVISPFMTHATPNSSDKTAYDFIFEGINGDSMPLSAYKGKVLLVVNTASKCGFTPQYKGLQDLYDRYKEQGLIVVGVPSNDFGAQEPGSASEIKQFCQLNYGVTFPMTTKYDVVGENAHPFFSWAASVLGFGAAPKWNFHKYLIGRNGKLIDFYLSSTTPDSAKLKGAIESALEKK